jgi:hypothetical protein
MGRRKRKHPLLQVAQTYLSQHMPDMSGARLSLRMLDGPPDAPRYAVTAEICTACPCPRGVPFALAANGQCPIAECPLRHSVRLLLNRRGTVLHTTISDIHWS